MACRCDSLGYQCPDCDRYYTNSERYSHIHDARFDSRGNFIGRDSDRWRDGDDFRGDWDD
jgi:hypothetical protein